MMSKGWTAIGEREKQYKYKVKRGWWSSTKAAFWVLANLLGSTRKWGLKRGCTERQPDEDVTLPREGKAVENLFYPTTVDLLRLQTVLSWFPSSDFQSNNVKHQNICAFVPRHEMPNYWHCLVLKCIVKKRITMTFYLVKILNIQWYLYIVTVCINLI